MVAAQRGDACGVGQEPLPSTSKGSGKGTKDQREGEKSAEILPGTPIDVDRMSYCSNVGNALYIILTCVNAHQGYCVSLSTPIYDQPSNRNNETRLAPGVGRGCGLTVSCWKRRPFAFRDAVDGDGRGEPFITARVAHAILIPQEPHRFNHKGR